MANGRYLQYPEFVVGAGGGSIASAVGGGNYTQIDVSVRIQPRKLITASAETILGTWATNFLGGPANIRGFKITLNTTGALHLHISSDGSAADAATVQSSATLASAGFTDNQAFWIRFTWRASDGKVQFFTAADSTTEPTSWTQLGTDLTISKSVIYNAAGSIWPGGNFLITTTSEGELYNGKIYDINIRRTIGGSLHASMGLSRLSLATSYGTYIDAQGISWTVAANNGIRGWGIRRLVESGGTATGRTFLG